MALRDTLDLCETDEQRAECEAEIERTVDALMRKVDSFTHFMAHLDSQIELAEKEIKLLKAREMAFANLQERLKQYAIYTMQRNGLRTLEGDTSKLTLRTNQPAVEVDDVQALPAEYKTIRQEIVPDKRAIKNAIVGGEDVPGARLKEPTVSLIRS
jgi:SMC interacting uncharacterized protein involved in chromosome segregation